MSRLEKILQTQPWSPISRRLGWFIAEVLITRNAVRIQELAQELETNGLTSLAQGCREFLLEAKRLHREKLHWNESQVKAWIFESRPEERTPQSPFKTFARLERSTSPVGEALLDERVKPKDLAEIFYMIIDGKMLDGMYVRYGFSSEVLKCFQGFPISESCFSDVKIYEQLPREIRRLHACELVEIHEVNDPESPDIHFAISLTGRGGSVRDLIDQHPTEASWFAPLFNDE